VNSRLVYRIAGQLIELSYATPLGYTILTEYYGGSLVKALKDVYREHTWQEWRFTKVPVGSWGDVTVHRRFFDWLAQQLHIDTPEKWYAVTADTIKQHGGSARVTSMFGSASNNPIEITYVCRRLLARVGIRE
jgi:hypothetical protein